MSTAPAPSERPGKAPPQFGTFSGVLRPVVLTILGAMLYLREGWLVGGTGLAGALLVIAAAHVVTGTTALSVSSLSTNVRVRPGGAFAIISQALGLEAGGAIGIPLFIAQSASAAMYLYAFTEGWNYVFPSHPPGVVVAVAFGVVAVVSWASAQLAARAQAVMLVVIAVALTSAALGLTNHDLVRPTLFSGDPEVTLREAFAIFFPAATGIMVGVGMSGSLKNPRKSIPRGTLGAWGIALLVYVLGAIWYSLIADPTELVADKTLMLSRALFGPLVVVGLLCSTLMAALSTLVAAPRLLQAMARHRVVPFGARLERESASGDPRNAAVASLALSGLFLLSGSLDAIAPIVTSFFALTYLSVNAVVGVEQSLAMISFRPTFRIPRFVPWLGVAACLLALTASSPLGGVPEVAFVLGIYLWLQRRQLETPWETMRSGVAVTVAAWAARRSIGVDRSERAWKPDLLVPVASVDELRTVLPLVEALGGFNGSAKIVALVPAATRRPRAGDTIVVEKANRLIEAVARAAEGLNGERIYTTWATSRADDYATGTVAVLDALQGAFFPPNLIVLDASRRSAAELQPVMEAAEDVGVGVAAYLPRDDGVAEGMGDVVVWLSDRSPSWGLQAHNVNLDLPVLAGYLMARVKGRRLRLVTVVRDPGQREVAAAFLAKLVEQGRMPGNTDTRVLHGDFLDLLSRADASLHVFGLPGQIDPERMRSLRTTAHGACLFLRDSGLESLLA